MRPDHITAIGTTIEWTAVRRWKRYQIDIRVKVAHGNGPARSSAHGRGSDVSEGGMALYAPVDLKVGDVVDLELTLPYSQQPLKLLGTVRNRNNFRYGIEYISPSVT